MAQKLTWDKIFAFYFQSHLYSSTKKHVNVTKVHVLNN